MNRVKVWDGWRGVAILLVLFGHFIPFKWIGEDRMGVDIFFALSGALMGIILFEKRISLKDFYIRRFSRVYPAFFVFVSFAFAFSYLRDVEFTIFEYISTLMFLRSYLPLEPHIWSSGVFIGHIWSLNVEEHAYVIMSVISIFIINKKSSAAVIIAFAVLLTLLSLLNIYYFNVDQKYYVITTHGALSFIFLSAGYSVLKREKEIKLPKYISILCLSVAFTLYIDGVPTWLYLIFAPLLLAIGVNHLDDCTGIFRSFLLSWPLQRLGLYSFSVYLWQQLFYEFTWKLPFSILSGPLLSVVVGMASFYFLEKPFRNYINSRYSHTPSYRSLTE